MWVDLEVARSPTFARPPQLHWALDKMSMERTK